MSFILGGIEWLISLIDYAQLSDRMIIILINKFKLLNIFLIYEVE